ncbi:MAG: hypothetical protein ABIH74_01720 [Candidatus Omnitrophota bacterium]
MKRLITVTMVACLIAGIAMTGCGVKKVATPQEAIKQAQILETPAKKVSYLVGQADAFYKAKDFQGAINIARYVLGNLDKDSPEAKQIIKKSQSAIIAKAKRPEQVVKK